jgi:hypothetical protein
MTSDDITMEWIKCDSCSAQALFLTRSTSGELYFCGHHRNKYSETIDKWAFEIVELNKVEETPQLEEERI